jgi:hypothetical protein
MSMRQDGHRYGAWKSDQTASRDSDAAPADCDCGDTVRELLVEIAATTAVFLAIILVVRALH